MGKLLMYKKDRHFTCLYKSALRTGVGLDAIRPLVDKVERDFNAHRYDKNYLVKIDIPASMTRDRRRHILLFEPQDFEWMETAELAGVAE